MIVLFVLFFHVPALATIEAVAELQESPFYSNEPITLLVTLSWCGKEDDYGVGVPKIAFPQEVVCSGVSSKAFRTGDTFQVEYRCILEVQECGEFSVESISVDYLAKGAEEQFTQRIPGFSFVVTDRPLVSVQMLWLLVVIGSLGLGTLIWLGVVWSKKNQGSERKGHASLTDEELHAWRERLERCRKLKAHGELEQFFNEASRLQRDIRSRSPQFVGCDTPVNRFAGLVDKVKFAGAEPPSSETEAYFRALEQMVNDVIDH